MTDTYYNEANYNSKPLIPPQRIHKKVFKDTVSGITWEWLGQGLQSRFARPRLRKPTGYRYILDEKKLNEIFGIVEYKKKEGSKKENDTK